LKEKKGKEIECNSCRGFVVQGGEELGTEKRDWAAIMLARCEEKGGGRKGKKNATTEFIKKGKGTKRGGFWLCP